MKDKYYIPATEQTPKPPVLSTAFWITFTHYWNLPEWSWGIVGILMLILWGGFIYRVWTQESKSAFK